MNDIFISYASADRPFAAALAEALLRDGWDVWWDRDLVGGDNFERDIESRLQSAKCVIVVWSQTSLQSKWVKGEARIGLARDVLIPLLKDQVLQPIDFRGVHAEDFSTWDGTQQGGPYARLVRSLERRLNKAPSVSPAPSSSPPREVAPTGQASAKPITLLRWWSLGAAAGVAYCLALYALATGMLLAPRNAQVFALFVGIHAVVGAVVAGVSRGVAVRIQFAAAGMLLGFLAWSGFEFTAARVILALFYGAPLGAVIGAILGWVVSQVRTLPGRNNA